MNAVNFWRKCSTCKKDIALNSKYYECSVSTCTGIRTGYVFCSVSCWEVHLPGAKHRDAGAVEKRSPAKAETTASFVAPGVSSNSTTSSGSASNSGSGQSVTSSQASASGPVRRIITSTPSVASNSTAKKSSMSDEVLVVVSKMKQYIRDLSEMNTSEEVNQILSDIVRTECEKAITSARAEGRKTVMARDFKKN